MFCLYVERLCSLNILLLLLLHNVLMYLIMAILVPEACDFTAASRLSEVAGVCLMLAPPASPCLTYPMTPVAVIPLMRNLESGESLVQCWPN